MTAIIDPRHIDAVIFDLDGVVTDTATVHQQAWSEAFHAVTGAPAPTADEYLRHLDGRSRMDGIASLLAARGLDLPVGEPGDSPSSRTHYGLGNAKNAVYLAHLQAGVRVFRSTVELVNQLHTAGIATAVFSASRNAAAVLESAGLANLFAVRVDGEDAVALDLRSKPEPDLLLEAARRLGVPPRRVAVIEDSIAGVVAAKAGGFGLVIWIDRDGTIPTSADLMVHDADDITMLSISGNPWTFAFDGYAPEQQKLREALLGIGNGYLTVRAALPEAASGRFHYPATYVGGLYNRLDDVVDGSTVSNESLVKVPNWLPLMFRAGPEWFEIDSSTVSNYRQELNLRHAILSERFDVRQADGTVIEVRQRRFVALHAPHLCALEVTLTPRNFDGELTIRTGIDHDVENDLVARYRRLSRRHLEPIRFGSEHDDVIATEMRTTQSQVSVAVAVRTTLDHDVDWGPSENDGLLCRDTTVQVRAGQAVRIRKIAAIFTGHDQAISEPFEAAVDAVRDARFDQLLACHQRAWNHRWNELAIDTGGRDDGQRILRLHLLQLAQAVSGNSADLDIGVPARLHGEAYRGHIFWDELFVLPVLNLRNPRLTRELLKYRYRRLDRARRTARDNGYAGALYPWQSGSDGREESQTKHINPQSGHWTTDASNLAQHAGIAVAYNAWQYFQANGDVDFLARYGAEMLLEIARFWVSRATFDKSTGRYHIRGVIGPDEFHSGYPNAPTSGIDDNAYTNVMAVWVIMRALESLRVIARRDRRALLETIECTEHDLSLWRDITHRMFVPFHDGVISQFRGYAELRELDWDGYEQRYGNIQRLDRILESEGDDVNRYQASKQADVLMLFFLLSADELRDVLRRLGYTIAPETLPRTIDYYLARTSHGSTLSSVVHTWVLARANRADAAKYFRQVLLADVADIQGGTSAEGLHLAAMAGSIDLVQRCFTGIEMRDGVLTVGATWPEPLGILGFAIQYRGHLLNLRVRGREVSITSHPGERPPIRVHCRGKTVLLQCGDTVRLF